MKTNFDREPIKVNFGNDPREDLMSECDFEESVELPSLPVINVCIFNFNFPALVDSGAEICAVSEETWGQLSEFHGQIPTFPSTGVRVSGAFKKGYRKIRQQSLLAFSILGHVIVHEFLLVPELSYPLIIGNDLLRLLKAKLDLGEQKILLYLNEQWVVIEELKRGYHDVFGEFSSEIKSIKTLDCSKFEYKPVSFQAGPVGDNKFR